MTFRVRLAVLLNGSWPARTIAGVAVIVALGLILIVKVTWKRANTGARIGAILACLVFFWLAVALVNVHSAAMVAAGTASGFSQLVTGIGRFIGAL